MQDMSQIGIGATTGPFANKYGFNTESSGYVETIISHYMVHYVGHVCMYYTLQITSKSRSKSRHTHVFLRSLIDLRLLFRFSFSRLSPPSLFSSYIHLRVHVVTQRHVAKATKVIEAEDPKKMSRTVSDILGSLRATRTR